MFDFAGIRRTAEAEGVLVGGWSLKHAIFGSRNDGVNKDNIESVNVVVDWDAEEERRLVRKLDFRVLLPCCMMYFVAYLDRANMGFAATLRAGSKSSLSEDLHLHGSQFNWAVSITYFAVTILLAPSNLLMKHLSGKMFFPFVILAVGIIICCVSAVQSLAGLLVARFALGIPEAAIPSTCIAYFSFWYKPSERALRIGLFYASNAFAEAIGGFLAIGIDHLNGKAGLESWRWLFLVEGLIAVVLTAPIAWLLLTFPETSSALSERERHIAVNRFGRGSSRSTDATWDMSAFSQVMVRPSTYMFFVSYICVQIVTEAMATFLPIILHQFARFPPHQATAYTSIVYFVLIPCYWAWSWHSDHTGERIWHSTIPILVSLPCFAVWMSVSARKSFSGISPIALYGMAFLGKFLSVCSPPFLSYRSATLYGASEQAVGVATTLASVSIAAIIGPQIYPSPDAPWYLPGFITSCGVLVFAFVGIMSLPILLAIEADKRKKTSGHCMPLRALEDVLHAQIVDEAIAAETEQQQDEEKTGSRTVHEERV